MSKQIYAVYAKHLDRNILLGYCRAESEADILAFYDDQKAYGIEITAISPINIPRGYAEQKAELVRQRDNLQQQLNEINVRIKLTGT